MRPTLFHWWSIFFQLRSRGSAQNEASSPALSIPVHFCPLPTAVVCLWVWNCMKLRRRFDAANRSGVRVAKSGRFRDANRIAPGSAGGMSLGLDGTGSAVSLTTESICPHRLSCRCNAYRRPQTVKVIIGRGWEKETE